MKCREVLKQYSSAMDGNVQDEELRVLQRHIRNCPDCSLRAHQLNSLKGSLRAMPRRTPPAELNTSLRVVASQACSQQSQLTEAGSAFFYRLDVIRVWGNNLMRPVALPAAGGLMAAIFLFSMIMPTFTVRAAGAVKEDVATVLTTQASLAHSRSYGSISEEIVVDVYVDGNGRMLDYTVPAGQVWQYDPETRRCIENWLLCSQFTPATWFGRPTYGRVRISVSGSVSKLDVEG